MSYNIQLYNFIIYYKYFLLNFSRQNYHTYQSSKISESLDLKMTSNKSSSGRPSLKLLIERYKYLDNLHLSIHCLKITMIQFRRNKVFSEMQLFFSGRKTKKKSFSDFVFLDRLHCSLYIFLVY